MPGSLDPLTGDPAPEKPSLRLERDHPFFGALDRIPDGYSQGSLGNSRWSATVRRSPDGKRIWLFAEELAGNDIVSFNLYALERTTLLKPCEMSSVKVLYFVLNYRPDDVSSATGGGG